MSILDPGSCVNESCDFFFNYYLIGGGGVQLPVHNRAGSGEGATVFRAVPEEAVPLVGWKMSVSSALLNTHQLCSLP